jgi:hypothetical protein
MSSSNDDIIYTPPDTPHIPNAAPMGIVQPGAAEYFESRPPLEFVPENVLIHTINVDANSLPDDLPYQSNWEKRDVNQQDWATFINFLLPDHMARGNEIIIDRKLQAETESEGGASEHTAQLPARRLKHNETNCVRLHRIPRQLLYSEQTPKPPFNNGTVDSLALAAWRFVLRRANNLFRALFLPMQLEMCRPTRLLPTLRLPAGEIGYPTCSFRSIMKGYDVEILLLLITTVCASDRSLWTVTALEWPLLPMMYRSQSRLLQRKIERLRRQCHPSCQKGAGIAKR